MADTPILLPENCTSAAEAKPHKEQFIDKCTEYAHFKGVTEYGARENSPWERRLLESIRIALNYEGKISKKVNDTYFADRFPFLLCEAVQERALANNNLSLADHRGMFSYDFMFTDLSATTGTLRPDVQRVIRKFAKQCLINFWPDYVYRDDEVALQAAPSRTY